MATNDNMLSKSGIKGNKWHHFKTPWFSKSAISKLRRSKRALLVVLLLASSAVALASLGIWRAVRPTPSLASMNAASTTGAAVKSSASPATADPPFTKLKEYVYAGGRLVTSEEISCVPTLIPASASSQQGGGPGSFNFSMPSICNWTATSNATSWLTVTSGASGSGAGMVNYSVAANGGAQRVGTITVNGQAFTVTQDPNPATCNYSLDTSGVSVSEQASSGSFHLTADAGCAWTAVSNATSWLTVTSAASGAGLATINYSIVANSGQQRVGSISITAGGQTVATFTVTQAPNPAVCTFTLSPSSQSFDVTGGSGSFNVTTQAGCLWNAAISVGWITITGGATGVGNGTVSFNVQANNGGSRTGSISVGGKVFTIAQGGSATVNPSSYQTPYGSGTAIDSPSNTGGITNINITGPGSANETCKWSGFPSVSGQLVSIHLKMGWSASVSSGSGGFGLDYSLDGGSWTNAAGVSLSNSSQSGSVDVLLPNGQDLTQVQVKMSIGGGVGPGSNFIASASVSNIRLEVTIAPPLISKVAPRGITTTGATITWTTNYNSDSQVEYGVDTGYGQSAPATPKQIIPQRQLYPEAATNGSSPTDTIKQSGMLLPPGSDAGPKVTRPQPNAPGRWFARPLGRAGLALLIACGVLALLLRINWRQARTWFARAVVCLGVVSRLRDQIASRLGELFRIAAAAYDKLQFVVVFGKKLLSGASYKLRFIGVFGKRLLAGTFDKLKFVGHFLAAFLPIFKVVSYCGAVMRLCKRNLAGLLPERVRAVARRALSSWRNSGVARLKPILRRALAIAMIVILATPLGPAQADGLARAARATWRTMSAAANRYGAGSDGGAFDRLIKALGKRPGKVVSAAAQAAQVASLQVCPTQHVMFVGECYTFTPVAFDSSNKVVHGAGMSWSSLTPAVATVSSFGEVEAVAVGTTTVTVQSGSASKPITIEVRSGTRPTGSNQQADLDPPTDCAAQQASMFAPQSAAGAPAQQSLIGADGVLYDWDPQATPGSLATQYRNAVGNPRFSATSQGGGGVPTSTQLGSYSYQFNVPVVSVGGRGASANIGMTLNSRVWNTDNGKVTFNYVGAYPGPGWSMGYGKIIRNYNATATGDGSGIGSGNSPGDYLLVAGDGTRIRLAAKYDNVSRWFHESDDGSFLKFNPTSGEMLYPDGTRMIYGVVNGCLLPTAMIGTNGGAITMTYRDYCEGNCQRVFRHRTALSAVRDTLGRYVTFHYYGDNDYTADPAQGHPAGELAAIKAPDMSGLQQEVIRVEYQLVTLKYDFDPSLAVDAPANNTQIQLMRRIYYPQTGRGFLFLDYSTYGMPRKISSRMGMTGAAGVITDGTEIAYTKYNYTTIDPSDPYGRDQGTAHLSDFPQFTQREEWWQGKTDATGAPTTATTRYVYSRTTDASTEVDTIKYDDVNRNYEEATTIGTDSSQLSFGKVISVEQRTSSTPQTTLGKRVLTYVTGLDGEVEVGTVETIDEAAHGKQVEFSYGHYGRVIEKSECGYKQASGYQITRRAVYDYDDDPIYLAARFLRLVIRTSVYDAKNNRGPNDDALMAKTETTYDGYTDPAINGIENYGLSSNQYPPNHDATYDQNKTLRGNATAVTTFSQFSPAVVSTTRHAKYDIFGNVVWAEVSCCVKKSFSFSSLTAYSEPDSVTSGSGATGSLNLQTTYQHNYFTGLVENESTDGQQITYVYDKALRLNSVTAPTNAVTLTQFDQDGNGNDLLTYLSQTTYDDQGTSKVITSRQWFDGAGRVIRAGTGPGSVPTSSYDMTATVYDGWGRVAKRSNPYPGDADGIPLSGVTQFWTTNTYDELSRVTQMTLPDTQTNHTIQTTYYGATDTSGARVVVTDTVGRQRKSEVDGLGRLVNVTEQNPANGNLEWVTSYSYDVLNNLTQVNQGGQLRTFYYDAKSRLTKEKTPEAGQITYDYTDFDAVSTRTDARGVITTYTYGDLNLLTGVSYNNVTGVAATAPVSITYKNASPGKGQIATVTDGTGGDGESYTYDSFGRLQSCTRKIDGISYLKQYEYNQASQMTSMTYPSGKKVNVGRDDRGRLSALQRVDVSGAPAYLSGINYRVDGLISSQTLGDGTTESFGYSDDRLQLTSQKVMKGGSTLLDLSYGYGALAGQMGNNTTAGNSGQLVSVTGTVSGQNRNQTFTYDNVGRLVAATGWGAWARGFDYDRHGNRTAVRDAVSGGNPLQNTVIAQSGGMTTNRIASVNGTAFSYDASGNVTGDGANSYTYDAENRLVSVSGLSSESYGYDAMNHRVKKVVGGVVTHYIWEGKVIAEYERGGGATPATGTRYYHQDRLSTRVITDGAGAVVGTTDHLPFGEEIGFTDESEKHKFTTYERDGALDYAVNRHYDPRQGRFNQADPLRMGAASLADPQSLNLYNYVGNDPVNFVDPSGLFSICYWHIEERSEFSPDGGTYRVNRPYLVFDGCINIDGPLGASGGGGGGGGGQGGGQLPDISTPKITAPVKPPPMNPPQFKFGGTCGVNPVTGAPGINAVSSGQLGELRPGQGGGGQFGAARRSGVPHQGIDVAAPEGTPIVANRAGTVISTYSGYAGGYGNSIVIQHASNAYTLYSHLSSFYSGFKDDGSFVSVTGGSAVAEGQIIGFSGTTGNASGLPITEQHLHFGVKSTLITLQLGERFEDPVAYLNNDCAPPPPR